MLHLISRSEKEPPSTLLWALFYMAQVCSCCISLLFNKIAYSHSLLLCLCSIMTDGESTTWLSLKSRKLCNIHQLLLIYTLSRFSYTVLFSPYLSRINLYINNFTSLYVTSVINITRQINEICRKYEIFNEVFFFV